MMKRLLIGVSLLVAVAGMPIAPAMAETELDRLVEQAKADAEAAEANLPEGYMETAAEVMTSSSVSILLTQGKLDEAIKLLQSYRKQYPNQPYSYSKMGEIKEEYLQDLYGAFHEYDEAKLKAFEALKAEQKKSGSASSELAQHREAIVDNSQKAVSVLLTIADRDKNRQAFTSAEAMMKAADTYHKTAESFINRSRAVELIMRNPKIDANMKEKLKQAALKGFAIAIKARPNLPDSYLYQGVFKARVLKDQAGAQADLKKAYELSKTQLWKAGIDRSTAALKALEQKNSGQITPNGVEQSLKVIEGGKTPAPVSTSVPSQAFQQLHFSQVSASARASYDRGLAKFNQQDFQGAIAEFDQALKEQSNYPEALNWRGGSHSRLNNTQKAMADYTQAITLKPDYSRPYNNRGLLKSQLNDMDGAIADLNVAIRLEPTLSVAYGNRGGTFLTLGKGAEAIKDFRQAIQLAPKNGSFYSRLCQGEIFEGNAQAGFEACDRAIALGFEHPMAYINRGIARGMRAKSRVYDPKAIADFDKAIQLDPEQAAAYYDRGKDLLLADPSRRQDAIRDLETAVRLFKQQGSQTPNQLKDLADYIASLKNPTAQTKQSEATKGSSNDFDTFFADFAKTLNESETKK